MLQDKIVVRGRDEGCIYADRENRDDAGLTASGANFPSREIRELDRYASQDGKGYGVHHSVVSIADGACCSTRDPPSRLLHL